MKRALIACLLLAGMLGGAHAADAPGKNEVERGRYLTRVAGCNDCHTPNYGPSNGKVDEKLWFRNDVGAPSPYARENRLDGAVDAGRL